MGNSDKKLVVAILGVGAIGRGVANALGRDRRIELRLFDPITEKEKYSSPRDATKDAEVVIVCVVNEQQVEEVLFDVDCGAVSIFSKPRVVICCSTVSPKFAKKVGERLVLEDRVAFLDAPVSGGPGKATMGTLTVMASGRDNAFEAAKIPLEVMAGKVVKVGSEWGLGSALKTVNQCLAGVHIAAAAEALSIAHKSGLDLQLVHEAIGAAAGGSWMFNDRGPRMIKALQGQDEAEIKSAIQIFVKDLKIVQTQARECDVDTKLASAALSLFQYGQEKLDLGKADDSSVVRVYQDPRPSVVEVYDEPRHNLVLRNEWCNAMVVRFEVGDTTLRHAHRHDSLYVFLTTTKVINDGICSGCFNDEVIAGTVRFGEHVKEPLLHRITCLGPNPQFCVDCEILKSPSYGCEDSLNAPFHELIKTRDKARVYKLVLKPGESHQTKYGFHHCIVVFNDCKVDTTINGGLVGGMDDGEKDASCMIDRSRGDVFWRDGPVLVHERNAGTEELCFFIFEYRVWPDKC